MTKLKTLKDLEMFFENPDYETPFEITKEDLKTAMYPVTHYADVDKLKQEAIKWIKMLRKIRKTFTEDNRFEIGWNEGRQNFIEEFFDITEEDLK